MSTTSSVKSRRMPMAACKAAHQESHGTGGAPRFTRRLPRGSLKPRFAPLASPFTPAMEAFHVGEVDVSGGVSEREDTWAKAFLRQASSQRVAVTASWIVNWFLLVAKIVVFALSRSKAVLAALADSAGAWRGRAGATISHGCQACQHVGCRARPGCVSASPSVLTACVFLQWTWRPRASWPLRRGTSSATTRATLLAGPAWRP